jgi:predicted lipoprotein with Yx(FWY)xxD motif
MLRRSVSIAMIAALSGFATAAIAPLGAGARSTSKSTTIEIRSTALGKALVNGSGFTVYVFTRDGRNRDTCVGISGCTGVWPVVRTTGAPSAGIGVKRSLLGTIKLADGIRQVTYAGHPLYSYSGDSSRGATGYVGARQFGGSWYAITAAGKLVK